MRPPTKASIISCIVSFSPPGWVCLPNNVSNEYSIISKKPDIPIPKKRISIRIVILLDEFCIFKKFNIFQPILKDINPDQKCKKSS